MLFGNISEGNFTFRNASNFADGTLDYMAVVVNKSALDLEGANITIFNDTFMYSKDEVDLKCKGLDSKCVSALKEVAVPPQAKNLEDNMMVIKTPNGTLEGSVDLLPLFVDPNLIDLVNGTLLINDDTLYYYINGTEIICKGDNDKCVG